jgi:hypothetical protein
MPRTTAYRPAAQIPPDQTFDIVLRSPLPNPLGRLSYRDIAADTGMPISTVHRILTDPTKLTRQQLARLMGTYKLPFDAIAEVIIRVPMASTYRRPAANEPRHDSHSPNGPDPLTGRQEQARYRNGRPVNPPILDPTVQRTPPPNLDPATLFHPQSPADRRANLPPKPRLMTLDEFKSYDPEPSDKHPRYPADNRDHTNPAHWYWEYRYATRPGTNPRERAYAIAPLRALAELDGDSSPRASAAVKARASEIMTAMQANAPIPPFDPSRPEFQIAPATKQPKRTKQKALTGKSKTK